MIYHASLESNSARGNVVCVVGMTGGQVDMQQHMNIAGGNHTSTPSTTLASF